MLFETCVGMLFARGEGEALTMLPTAEKTVSLHLVVQTSLPEAVFTDTEGL